MEKFSAFRDPGTGIHPFLPPVPPTPPSAFLIVLMPIRVVVAIVRITLWIALILVHVLVLILTAPLALIPSIYSTVTRYLKSTHSYLIFLVLGILIKEEVVAVSKSRSNASPLPWLPKAGDIIVSNWCSWVEIVWLQARYSAICVLPIAKPPAPSATTSANSSPITSLGRRSGTGSAAISLPPPVSNLPRASILGYREVSQGDILSALGLTPPFDGSAYNPDAEYQSLETIRAKAKGPILVFPECTTSNGRALLRFAECFGTNSTVPVKGYNVWLVCVKYEAPTSTTPSLTIPVPPSSVLPTFVYNVLVVASSLSLQQVHFRLLNSGESPSSGSFLASQYVTVGIKDQLAETCAALIAQLGRIRRTQMGWEDKMTFLQFYSEKKTPRQKKA